VTPICEAYDFTATCFLRKPIHSGWVFLIDWRTALAVIIFFLFFNSINNFFIKQTMLCQVKNAKKLINFKNIFQPKNDKNSLNLFCRAICEVFVLSAQWLKFSRTAVCICIL